ncbi:MAG TPA: LuxR C-terminal-related transcriptional regulator [Streptosporangiaceae bacterium]|nr:LuxR C-terminal-related transcriptional regulator [Streptosporangiaceae bacterium]
MLIGRAKEADALECVLAEIRAGLSGMLVLRGEAGIGKTALLDWAVGQAGDMQVARVTGVESEMSMGFAGLHLLLLPFLGGLERLPEPQREALESAFGLVAGSAPDRFLVGVAALTLITDAAVQRPVLCVVDDAQWLDRVSVEVLGFVARRLYADRVGMVFAAGDAEESAVALEGLPELTVGGLADEAAGELLASSAGGPIDAQVRDQIVAEASGNPLALLEFEAGLTPDELSGAAPLTRPLRFGGRLEELYLSQVRALPADAQLLLLLAAADPLGEPGKIWRAAENLGIDPEVAALPAVERLVSWAPQIQFRHPLMRSVAYYDARVTARRQVHAALAAASDPERDPDRRAWHLAQAAAGPDEQVARELEQSADRASARGGWGSRAAFLEQAAGLTPDQGRRAQRLLRAAEARLAADQVPAARVLVGQAAPHLVDPLARGNARRLEGLILFRAGELAKAPSVLLDAAQIIAPCDVRLARDTLHEALEMALLSDGSGSGVTEVLRAARSAPRMESPQATIVDLLLDGFAALGERRVKAAVDLLRQAIAPLTGHGPFPDEAMQCFMTIGLAARQAYDDSAWHELTERYVAAAQARGAFRFVPLGLVFMAHNQLLEGRIAAAEATAVEGRALCGSTGYPAPRVGFAGVELATLAWRGQEAETRRLAGQLLPEFAGRGIAVGARLVNQALAVLELSLGHYQEAARRAFGTHTEPPVLTLASEVDVMVESAVRCGDREAASSVLEAFAPRARACGTHWALGLLARCRALLAADEDAEADYRLAIDHLRQCRIAPQLARSHQLYGEWLRRQRRRREARDQLRTACQMFEAMDMERFAERARAELLATGERARRRSVETEQVLTPQEAQIARLASDGASNREIAARLLIGASTVEHHLRKVYRKLGVTSRVQLVHALPAREGA